jgi:DMSO/TMAO reductase YedYZ molybdopterin-dependent catalytic subunit
MTDSRVADDATNRSLARRDFLRLGLVAGPVSLLAACGWDGGSSLEPRLRRFSRINDWVGEKVLHSSDRLARQYPVSERTRDFPTYHVHRPTPPMIENPAAWSLDVGGEVRKPTRFTLEMLRQLPSVTYTVKHHCVEGWTAIGTWTGVPFSTIAALVEPTAAAEYLRFNSFDVDRGGVQYYNGWDLKSAMHPQTILAYAFNEQPLEPARGAPIRLYSPVKLGYKLTKYLSSVSFTRERPGGYWEDLGYPWLGGV